MQSKTTCPSPVRHVPGRSPPTGHRRPDYAFPPDRPARSRQHAVRRTWRSSQHGRCIHEVQRGSFVGCLQAGHHVCAASDYLLPAAGPAQVTPFMPQSSAAPFGQCGRGTARVVPSPVVKERRHLVRHRPPRPKRLRCRNTTGTHGSWCEKVLVDRTRSHRSSVTRTRPWLIAAENTSSSPWPAKPMSCTDRHHGRARRAAAHSERASLEEPVQAEGASRGVPRLAYALRRLCVPSNPLVDFRRRALRRSRSRAGPGPRASPFLGHRTHPNLRPA